MRKPLAAITIGFTLLMGVTAASADSLYRGTTTPSQKPDQQGWIYLKTAYPTTPSAQATKSGTVLDTGNSKNYAGYFKRSPFKLDRNTGYTISFSLQINSESHSSNNNRAGFSVIVASNRLSKETQPFALELGFWTNSIWAYNTNASRGENVSYNTKAGVKNYVLSIKGNRYQLFISGSAKPFLEGPLRQYTSYTPPPGFPNPYTTPNLIFMGDDTTSANAKVTISRVDASRVSNSQQLFSSRSE